MHIPEKTQIEKLPKWAREYISSLLREREVAVRTLNEFCDKQTVSKIYVDENPCTGEESGPSIKRQYIQSERINVKHAGVWLVIICRDGYIGLQWGGEDESPHDIALIPEYYQCAKLVSKENMR